MTKTLRLIPYPLKAETGSGSIVCEKIRLCGVSELNGLVISDYLKEHNVAVAEDGVSVRYACEEGFEGGKEAYSLEVSANGITIAAADESGLFYAFVTLIQLLYNYKNELPLCRIYDAPALRYRGFMLDTGRYFFDKKDVLRIADLCALHKLNVLHLHLTEDQGWRIQIDKYPLLTEKGSVRSHTNFGIKPHGGFYSKDDIREIIAYCNARNIEVIPEFDIPGHSRAALACYPWLGCFNRKLTVATHTGVKHDILCAGKESTYRFVYDVLDEIMQLFGDNTRFIHLGGDEAVKTRWKICPDCQAKMKELGIETEDGLQAYFMQCVAKYVVDKGFTPVMWNEVNLSLPCHDNMVWQLWTTADGAVTTEKIVGAACRRGGLINSDSAFAYLDLPYSYISLEKSYSFKPVPDCADEAKAYGAEAALWSEYVPDFKTACRRTLPRLCAIADCVWGKNGGDFKEFMSRLDYTSDYLKSLGYRGASYRQTMPGKVRALFQTLWFERRQLHWQGLHNLIENIAVSIKYKK